MIVLIAVFFLTSILSVVTGSTSLITVPVMIALGIEAHVAVATNMLALILMSAGGSLPFLGRGVLRRNRLLPSIVLTLLGNLSFLEHNLRRDFSLSDCPLGTQSCEPNQTPWEPHDVTIFATGSPCIRRSRTNRWRIETGLIAQF
jgi:hypothetical protein